LLNLANGRSEGKIPRVPLYDVPPNRVYQLERAVRRVIPFHVFVGYIRHEKNRAQTSCPEARQISVPLARFRPDIEAVRHTPGDIIVGIDQERGAVYLQDLGIGDRARLAAQQQSREAQGGNPKAHVHTVTSW
jgi:hypothetical protein